MDHQICATKSSSVTTSINKICVVMRLMQNYSLEQLCYSISFDANWTIYTLANRSFNGMVLHVIARFCDLTPSDLFLSAYINSEVYVNEPNSTEKWNPACHWSNSSFIISVPILSHFPCLSTSTFKIKFHLKRKPCVFFC